MAVVRPYGYEFTVTIWHYMKTSERTYLHMWIYSLYDNIFHLKCKGIYTCCSLPAISCYFKLSPNKINDFQKWFHLDFVIVFGVCRYDCYIVFCATKWKQQKITTYSNETKIDRQFYILYIWWQFKVYFLNDVCVCRILLG